MAEFLGLKAVGWRLMMGTWWEKVLGVVLFTTAALAAFYVVYSIARRLQRYWRGKLDTSKSSKAIARYFGILRERARPLSLRKDSKKQPKSFGVFLGSLSNPPTPSEQRILSQWELVILDPLQNGVLDAVTSHWTPATKVGRLDVGRNGKSLGSFGDKEVITSLGTVIQTITAGFKRHQDLHSPFTGIALANWQKDFQPAVLNELTAHIIQLGFAVYLEISEPDFMSEADSRAINMGVVSGLICRNGTILRNGDRRNYYQMAAIRPATRALAKHVSMHPSTVMMWETIDDNIEIQQAVVKRSFDWCRFNSALSWIGPSAALTDADAAVTRTVKGEPLGALMWLKNDGIMHLHDLWRLNKKISPKACNDGSIYNSLNSFVPDLKNKLALSSSFVFRPASDQPSAVIKAFDWATNPEIVESNPFSVSPRGHDYTALGCFSLGIECTTEDFQGQTSVQRRLRDLKLLKPIPEEDTRDLLSRLRVLYEAAGSWASQPEVFQAVKELIDLLAAQLLDSGDARVSIYVGLHSGFRANSGAQFWGLYDANAGTNVTDIFISGNTNDLASAVLHTFLSSRGCTRAQCFEAEVILAHRNNSLDEDFGLPSRIVKDLEQLSSTEAMLLLQYLVRSTHDESIQLSEKVQKVCKQQLMVVPTVQQLRALNSTAYLRGEISAEDLVESRLSWYRNEGCDCPDVLSATSLFTEIDARLQDVLLNGESQILSQLEIVFRHILQAKRIDAAADMFALSVFCAFRKLAVNEVYMEVLDRNPLPNAHTDQAACFAEMFALGSRCETYFDMTPNSMGKVLAQRYRAYYKVNQPPQRDDMTTELPTAYASKQIDNDPAYAQAKLPVYYKVTFLGIFAVPALIDILFLTTIGRGLYVTAFMDEDEKIMATTALMSGLLLCGGIGTWISAGGSYYLHSMAFAALNMFVLTRLLAGVAITLGGGLIAFLIIGIVKNFYAATIFFLYFFLLTTYLSLLSTLAIYQMPGCMFQSGRTLIMYCLPILLISPLVTLWVDHDIVFYLSFLSTFTLALLLSTRRVIAEWGTWFLQVPSVTDTEVVNWYTKNAASQSEKEPMFPEGTDLAATPLPRTALMEAVNKERARRFWQKRTSDELVLKIVDGYAKTMFLMDWYCKYSRTPMPYQFSPTWNLQCKAAIDTLRDMQKGLKLHSAFLHWRYAGPEVWCGVLYFVIALEDKWVALFTGGNIVGLSTSSETFRLAVGFGLSYYLISAVCLDAIGQPLWALANKKEPTPVSSMVSLREARQRDLQANRKLYWRNLVKLFFVHLWGISITSALMWTFEANKDAMIMYIAYVGAYSGLLWYQYNRIFTGPAALKDLCIAASIGFIVGIPLRVYNREFSYSAVIALACATWTCAILSFITSKVGSFKWTRQGYQAKSKSIGEKSVFYSSTVFGTEPTFSQTTLLKIYDATYAQPAEGRFRVNPSGHPGDTVRDVLAQAAEQRSHHLRAAFPTSEDMLVRTLELWKNGEIIVDLAPPHHLFEEEQKLKSITRKDGGKIRILVFLGLDLINNQWRQDVPRNCKVIAEAIMQATAESIFGIPRDHAALAELLVSNNGEDEIALPEGVKRQIETSGSERSRILQSSAKELLRHLLLGLDCDAEWDLLPLPARSFLLRRCCGETCHISEEQLSWIQNRSRRIHPLATTEECVARYNLAASLAVITAMHAEALEWDSTYLNPLNGPPSPMLMSDAAMSSSTNLISNIVKPRLLDRIQMPLLRAWNGFRVCLKFLVVSLVADPEFPRELDYLISGQPWVVRRPVTLFLNSVWMFCKSLQRFCLPFFLFHGRERVQTIFNRMQGMKTTIEKNRIIIENINGSSTCFLVEKPDGHTELRQYSGILDKQPDGLQNLMAINMYTDKMVLLKREEYANWALVNTFIYEYPENSENSSLKLPMERHCIQGKLDKQVVHYDAKGYITTGSTIKDGNLVEFKFWYRKHAKFDDELLRGEFVLPHIAIRVIWSVPSPTSDKADTWIPHSKVIQATFTQDGCTYKAKWDYDHKFHPVIKTTVNGLEVPTPDMIQYDWFNVLTKPRNCSFLSDNPLFSFKSVKSSFLSRLFRLNSQRYAVSTSRARTYLWKSWKDSKDLDAVTTRWLDEAALRSDRVLKPYWRNRDLGRLKAAEEYLDAQADTVMARVDIDPEVSSWTPLAYKISDLFTFGQGGDSRINTRRVGTQLYRDSKKALHVLAMDTGTWPNEGGGVSACRRDMVNDLKTIRWHVLAESANDFGVPKFQIERNVQSLTVLPLWGLDFLTPTHGVFQDSLDSEVQRKLNKTSTREIKQRFFPILRTLVRCARAIRIDHQWIEEAGKALVDLNDYFESGRHWSEVWMSDTVKKEWRKLWLSEDADNVTPISEWLDAERPTISHLDQALDMWHRYLFIFSVPVPEDIPDVFQASHHFTGASFGVLCKLKRKCSLSVWDHCISWREVTVFLSSAMSFDAPFVCTSLMSISRMASVLILHHADIVLPCADFFNPGWEVEIGTQEGTLGHRNTYARKIDPVVNGICNMEKFKPIESIKTERPTAVMLSHVRFVKDIKNALLAADIIVNEWGFKDYQLDIYGDMEKAPAYSVECKEILASKGLRDHVALRGLGSPSKVLADAWLFLNSSISEGLPLAMGEAALTGAPVVCTDVGASFRVVTNKQTGKPFSPCVAPNDAYSIARAQINVLAMLDEWSEYADDAPGERPKMSLHPSPEEVQQITKRMYDKVEQRRRLGMIGRSNVQMNFSQERYLREHEQMLWIGKHQSASYHTRSSRRTPAVNRSLLRPGWFSRAEEEARLIGEEGSSRVESSASSIFGKGTPWNVNPDSSASSMFRAPPPRNALESL